MEMIFLWISEATDVGRNLQLHLKKKKVCKYQVKYNFYISDNHYYYYYIDLLFHGFPKLIFS